MWHALSNAARAASEAGAHERSKVLWLLADATSMRLTSESANQPFSAMSVFGDKRTTLPEDFTDADIDFFHDVVPLVTNSRLQARLADLVWLRKHSPRVPDMAVAAIDAYRLLPLELHSWLRDGRESWSRALHLSRNLRATAGTRFDDMESAMRAALDNSTRVDRFFPRQLADVMQKFGLERRDRTGVATKLEDLGKQADDEGDLEGARTFYSAAASWYGRAGDKVGAARTTFNESECWVRQAQARAEGAQSSQIVATSFYENAIQTLRTIGRAQRAALSVDERIEELRMSLAEAGEKSLEEMGMISTPGVNIDELVSAARRDVSGKPVLEALANFCAFYEGANVARAREEALEKLRNFPLQALMSSTLMSADGRVIAKRPAMSLNAQMTDTDEEAIWASMVQDHMLTVQLLVQGQVAPAWHVLVLEHRLVEEEFMQLARNASIVPKDRARLVGKGLYAGYDGDFVTAVHILVPQLENLVRHHLKAGGAITSHLDNTGVVTENGLSTLMELPLAIQVFGEGVCFEIKALFCSPHGPNLRNNLAHGLLDDDACTSVPGVYAWWFMFRLVFTNFWNRHHQSLASAKAQQEQSEQAEDERPADPDAG